MGVKKEDVSFRFEGGLFWFPPTSTTYQGTRKLFLPSKTSHGMWLVTAMLIDCGASIRDHGRSSRLAGSKTSCPSAFVATSAVDPQLFSQRFVVCKLLYRLI